MSNYSALDEVLTCREAAALVGYSQGHIKLLCAEGKLQARLTAAGWLIAKQSVFEFVFQKQMAIAKKVQPK